MNAEDLKILQAASKVLNEPRPPKGAVAILNQYAAAELPERIGMPPDELATVVALRLMDIPGELK
ncbi:MAG TPA: hypothetical protein VHB50_12515 [Bryobacteraceae bacterium]|nr:hypothetical protein [Bryobacteraceae bacterium]